MALPHTAWKPGKSGNPGGRPKALVDVQALARKQTSKNLETLVELRDNCEEHSVRVKCAIALHEIAWGKPSQALQHTGADNGPVIFSWIQ